MVLKFLFSAQLVQTLSQVDALFSRMVSISVTRLKQDEELCSIRRPHWKVICIQQEWKIYLLGLQKCGVTKWNFISRLYKKKRMQGACCGHHLTHAHNRITCQVSGNHGQLFRACYQHGIADRYCIYGASFFLGTLKIAIDRRSFLVIFCAFYFFPFFF